MGTEADLSAMQKQITDMQKMMSDLTETMGNVKNANAQVTVQVIRQSQQIAMLQDNLAKVTSSRAAVEFLNSQLQARSNYAQWILGAISIASQEYSSILGLKDAQKFTAVDVLQSIATLTLPGIGACKKMLDEWEEKGSRIQKIAGSLGNNAGAWYGFISAEKSEVDRTGLNVANGANSAIRSTLSAVYSQIGRATWVTSFLKMQAINLNKSEAEIRNLWSMAGMSVIDAGTIANLLNNPSELDLMAKSILYDMLKAYTGKWVTYSLNASVADKALGPYGSSLGPSEEAFEYASGVHKAAEYLRNNLPEDGNSYGEFTGMNQATRDEIYSRFGTMEWFYSFSKTHRPSIASYRDMVKYWGLAAN